MFKRLVFIQNGIVELVDFVGLAYYQEGKDIVFRVILECSSLRDFGP
jgi:hypothetical protein